MDKDELFESGLKKYEQEDFEAAFALFRQAAELGDAGSQDYLGFMYGEGQGVPKDAQQELFWHKRAWTTQKERGHACNVAVTYVKQGKRKLAIEWWRKSIAMNDGDSALALAKFLKRSGKGRGREQVIELLEMAANSEESLHITPAGKEEAQELLDSLNSIR